MPEFRDFAEQLKTAGVAIEGEAILSANAERAESWTGVVAEAALAGRKNGIRFVRISAGRPSGETLQQIVRGYPFTPVQQAAVIDNVMDL